MNKSRSLKIPNTSNTKNNIGNPTSKKRKSNAKESNANKHKSKRLEKEKPQIQKPFLKWVGGKTQILDRIISKFPTQMNNYHELFLGGGSVLLALMSLRKQGRIKIKNKIYAYDFNKKLIQVYKHIQTHNNQLFAHIQHYINSCHTINGTVVIRNPKNAMEAKTSKESYYYWMRHKFNAITENSVERSALFMVLNKTCFRGLYREGPNGFNVSYGHSKKTPTIVSKEELDRISDLIQDVEFIHSDFQESIKAVQSGDFVYLDPPYVPLNPNTFVGYVRKGFGTKRHHELFDKIQQLEKGIQFVLSNSDTPMVRNTFQKNYKMEIIVARRSINSKKPQSTASEVIVWNFYYM